MFIVDYRDKLPKTFNIYLWPDMHEGFNGTSKKKITKAVTLVSADNSVRRTGLAGEWAAYSRDCPDPWQT